MTKRLKIVFILLAFGLIISSVQSVRAQCAMCTTAVESNSQNGGSTANGLNNGIMYLLAAPYIAIAAVGFIWYKKYRRKNVNISMRDEKLHLN
jgi:hypothetical protein